MGTRRKKPDVSDHTATAEREFVRGERPRAAAAPEGATVQLGTRVTPELKERLEDAVHARRRARQHPFTVRDVVTEALEQWLDRNAG